VIAAPPEVIASLPHIEPDSVHAVLDRRERQDLKSILPLLGGARSSVLTEPRKTARVNIIIAFEGGRRVEAEAVILLVDKASDPYRILAWRDDFDGSF
jgi:general secretion pathway protein K